MLSLNNRSRNTKCARLHWTITSEEKKSMSFVLFLLFLRHLLTLTAASVSPLPLPPLMEWWFGKYYGAQNRPSEQHSTAWLALWWIPASDCLSSVLYKESLSCAPQECERLMLRSGYLATVGDQQVDNENIPQTSMQARMAAKKKETHIYALRKLFHDWSAFLSQLPGLEVAMVDELCWGENEIGKSEKE